MTVIGNRRSTVVLYTDASDIDSHRVRLVLAEKGIEAEAVIVDTGIDNEGLLQLNPYGTCPTLLDRELALYGAQVIIDYLDERYPHPPFMPVDPVSRARTRLALYRVELDWYSLLSKVLGRNDDSETAQKMLAQSLTDANEVFAAMPYFLSEEYSILDAALAPLLWRLPACGIVLPQEAHAVADYAQRMFERAGFQTSLTDAERGMSL